MSTKTALKKVFKIICRSHLAKELDISYQAINRWYDFNCMPATEFNGKTKYSKKIQELTNGEVTIEDLCGFLPPPQSPGWKGK